jgi:hypothetical protein
LFCVWPLAEFEGKNTATFFILKSFCTNKNGVMERPDNLHRNSGFRLSSDGTRMLKIYSQSSHVITPYLSPFKQDGQWHCYHLFCYLQYKFTSIYRLYLQNIYWHFHSQAKPVTFSCTSFFKFKIYSAMIKY